MTAQLIYALGKAYDDVGDHDRAFGWYAQGAPLMRARDRFDAAADTALTQERIRDYSRENLARLTPSGCGSRRVMFVTGLPRSGTTLVEQILTSHSQVTEGAEVNLMSQALLPAARGSLADALAYQARSAGPDPWGDVGCDYLDMIGQRFGSDGLVVDKTLNHSRLMGLLLHALPQARLVWVRRKPDDVALSCYRTFFTVPWSWSFADIAAYFRNDDQLHAHWSQVFGDRILTVPYEELVRDPANWIPKILTHVGLTQEPACFTPDQQARTVMTASIAQVRAPISADRIGSAQAYHDRLKPFRDAYYR